MQDIRIIVNTNKGPIEATLKPSAAPVTVANFLNLAKRGYYNGITFHRVIPQFMIQGGDPTGTGRGGPGYRFEDELPEHGQYQLGSLAMANAGPNTNGSQFFVISGGQGMQLPPNYALFGKLIDGLEVLADIQSTRTGAGDRPVQDVVIETITITQS